MKLVHKKSGYFHRCIMSDRNSYENIYPAYAPIKFELLNNNFDFRLTSIDPLAQKFLKIRPKLLNGNVFTYPAGDPEARVGVLVSINQKGNQFLTFFREVSPYSVALKTRYSGVMFHYDETLGITFFEMNHENIYLQCEI